MEKTIVRLLLTLVLYASYGAPACENSWSTYKQELCIKAFTNDGNDLETYEGAKNFCASLGDDASLAIVKDEEMQQLLANNIIEGIFDYIWLGGRYDANTSQFKWEDGQSLNYTNWMAGYPRTDNLEDAPCIELRPQEETRSGVQEANNNHGKWAHESCLKRNLVMCQKPMTWSLKDAVNAIKDLQQQHEQELLEVQEELSNLNSDLASANSKVENLSSELINTNSKLANATSKIEDMGSELTKTNSELANANSKIANMSFELVNVNSKLATTNTELAAIKSRVVPVGSIYVEYYNQPSPRTLWPNLSWQDITSTYAGMFFRAQGDNAASWGTIQSACAPRITQTEFQETRGHYWAYPFVNHLPSSGWSPYGAVGKVVWKEGGATYTHGLRFNTADCEVRPRNQAIRIWKRTA